MQTLSYSRRRGEIETYFDLTAADAWKRLTSDAPVSGIRATVRAGRDRMRATLLDWLPQNLSGMRILDAGCGTGALSIEAARRGADVVGVDIAPTLIAIAGERRDAELASQGSQPHSRRPGTIVFRAGDMLSPSHGRFDAIVAMDSLIHYAPADKIDILARLADRCDGALLFTFAPRTPALAAMHAVGRLFPRQNRAPSIEPVAPDRLARLIATDTGLAGWQVGRSERIVSGFYTSQAMELIAP
ncbi:MAG: magnesium protoporphyrin IX methyltransferase [Hyphomicrobiaceae bacterium]|nr:magnesium protoporphyrin IX methyltransferase [Hyphomicrobiaceae bacterium]